MRILCMEELYNDVTKKCTEMLYLEFIISASKLKVMPKKRGWLRTLICAFPELAGAEISAMMVRQISVHMFIPTRSLTDE